MSSYSSSPSLPNRTKSQPHPPSSSKPVYANFASEKLTIGAGVAIYHLATERVVVCWHSRDRYWFLPKGRRNVGEETGDAAVREGFEESGYRCRLLPLPIPHRQPASEDEDPDAPEAFVTEPLWTQLLPQSSTAQYILSWYAAETVSELIEKELSAVTTGRTYTAPPTWPKDLSLIGRITQDVVTDSAGVRDVYEPCRHEGTGVDEEELLYESYLLPIQEARRKLKGSIMEDVVRRGWEAVLLRKKMEAAATTTTKTAK